MFSLFGVKFVSWILLARNRWMVMIFAGLLYLGSACGIVLHPGDCEPNYIEWTDRPVDDVVGGWGSHASCVVISPDCVITTRHQGGGVGSSVEVGGVTYRVERIWNHPGVGDPGGDNFGSVDLRIAQLAGADFSDYAELYRDGDEVETGKDIVIGGFGLGRGAALESSGIVYGYEWDEDSVGVNRRLRWCTNRIDSILDNVQAANNGQTLQIHDYVVGDFDGPCETVYEGIVAGRDSGSGWFVEVDGEWKLVGVTWGVEHGESRQSLFGSRLYPTIARADKMYALRMSSYAGWVRDVLQEACRYGDCGVDMDDVAEFARYWLRGDCSGANNNCHGWDVNRDGFVDFVDYGILGGHFTIERDG